MRTPEEILKSILTIEAMRVNNPDYTFNKVIEAMEEYGKQQWNEAIEAAAEEAKSKCVIYEIPNNSTDYTGVTKKIKLTSDVDKQSILKLKK